MHTRENRKPEKDRGIYPDKYGIRVIARVAGLVARKRFPLGTSYTIMRAWRNRTKAELSFQVRRETIAAANPPMNRSLDGWCYIYFVRIGGDVKIGRAVDLKSRLRTLQTASPQPIDLLAVVPAHATFEAAIHTRFAHLRHDGEWFSIDDELIAFIAKLATGVNPVALLMDPDGVPQ